MANWNGKLLGTAMGALVGGYWGALAGAVIGHQFDAQDARTDKSANGAARPANDSSVFDRGASNQDATATAGAAAAGADAPTAGAPPSKLQTRFLQGTFRLMGHVAKSDGRVSEREIAAAWRMMRALHLNDDQTQEAMECFRDGKQPGFTIATGLRELREALHSQPQLAHFFIELQLQAALLGNGLGPQPRSRVQSAAHFLGLEPPQFAQIEAMVRWQQQAQAEQGGSRAAPGAASDAAAARAAAERQAEAYRLLEASVKESDEQIVKAYRRQMSKHHPDKLQSKGLPEAWIERAKERTQQIQAAYELVRTARGMQ